MIMICYLLLQQVDCESIRLSLKQLLVQLFYRVWAFRSLLVCAVVYYQRVHNYG